MSRWWTILIWIFVLASSSALAAWDVEVVDSSGNVGMFCALALDSQGYECISYHDVGARDLRYAYQDATGWNYEVPDSTGSTGWHTSLAMTATGVPCIAYWDYGMNQLRYVEWATFWNTETVPGTTGAGSHPSLCHSPAGYPHISFVDYSAGSVRHTTRQPGGWVLQTVDAGAGTSGAPTSIAWDNVGFTRFAYLQTGRGLMQAYDVTPATSSTETIEMAPGAGTDQSLAIGSDGYSRIAYVTAATTNELVYAQDGPGGWNYQTVYNGTGEVWECSLALRDGDSPCIAYSLQYPAELRFAIREGSTWYSDTIHQPITRPLDISLAIEVGGRAHIAYYNLGDGDLMIARERPPPTLGVRLEMPGTHFTPGAQCALSASLHNAGAPMQNVPLAVVLDVNGSYWFWPSWRTAPFDYQLVSVPSPVSEMWIIPDFTWPGGIGGSASGIVFWGAMLNPGMTAILGGNDGLGSWTFGYGP